MFLFIIDRLKLINAPADSPEENTLFENDMNADDLLKNILAA